MSERDDLARDLLGEIPDELIMPVRGNGIYAAVRWLVKDLARIREDLAAAREELDDLRCRAVVAVDAYNESERLVGLPGARTAAAKIALRVAVRALCGRPG